LKLLPFGPEQHPRHIEVYEDADVVVAPAAGRFIEPNALDSTVISRSHGLVHVVMDHTPQTGVVLTHEPCRCRYRHVRHHGQQQSLE
jgi:hypothetical protein